MAEIVWSSVAREDLRRAVAYISNDSPTYARSWALGVRQAIARLTEFPLSGRQVPEDHTGIYRELLIGNYRAIYRMEAETVVLVAIVHGARRLRLPT